MFEELKTSGEGISESPHEKIMVLKNDISHGWNIVLGEAEDLIKKSKTFNVNNIKKALKDILPEYESSIKEENFPVDSSTIKRHL